MGFIEGLGLGCDEGCQEGPPVGTSDGLFVGEELGILDGIGVGPSEGYVEGLWLGIKEGALLGVIFDADTALFRDSGLMETAERLVTPEASAFCLIVFDKFPLLTFVSICPVTSNPTFSAAVRSPPSQPPSQVTPLRLISISMAVEKEFCNLRFPLTSMPPILETSALLESGRYAIMDSSRTLTTPAVDVESSPMMLKLSN